MGYVRILVSANADLFHVYILRLLIQASEKAAMGSRARLGGPHSENVHQHPDASQPNSEDMARCFDPISLRRCLPARIFRG